MEGGQKVTVAKMLEWGAICARVGSTSKTSANFDVAFVTFCLTPITMSHGTCKMEDRYDVMVSGQVLWY